MATQLDTAFQNDLARFLGGRSFEDACAAFDRNGYIVFENVLSPDEVAVQRDALKPWIGADMRGRNNFEGSASNRVYAMLAKDPVFAALVAHPLQLAFAERDLGRSCLLYACLAINLLPGETPQPWHFDDSHCGLPRPRPPLSLSSFWSISDTTVENGATEIIPGSHLWDSQEPEGANRAEDFLPRLKGDLSGSDHPDALQIEMPAGSLMLAKGTLWHRGAANRSSQPRLIVTPQFCVGWCRPLEQQLLAVPPEKAAALPERVRELLGYSIHPPFMGYVDGMHPSRTIPQG